MKKLRKIILSALLFTFAFITVHDYVIPELNQHISCEISSVDSSKSLHDAKLQLHESIHSFILEPILSSNNIYVLDTYQKQIQDREFFISQVNIVPKRPPLA